MKFLLILGFLLGFGGIMTAAGLAPIAGHERVASRSSVANNGGRLETFVIRLPADRIASTGSVDAAAFAIDPITEIEPPAELAGAAFIVEQFKLRNVAGDVIGIAMRHWTSADDASASGWTLSIPSRGTLVWGSAGNAPGILATALAGAGVQSGIGWQGDLSVPLARDDNEGQVIAGTEEFAGGTGFVEEIWDISGVGGTGELRGTITLNTRVSRAQ